MKKHLIAKALLIGFTTVPTIIGISSCSDNSQLLVNGGSINLISQSSGFDNNFWSSRLNNENVSDTTFWSIEPATKGVYFRYDTQKQGINVLWNDMEPGIYSFRVKGEVKGFNTSKIGYSPIIRLLVQGSTPILGGTNEIIGSQSGQYDQRPWTVSYHSKDYSASGNWSIDGQGDLINRISVIYDSQKKGAYIKWIDLFPGRYIFTIRCVFQTTEGDYVQAVSNVITLIVSAHDEIILSGGTQYNTVLVNQQGRDNEPFKVISVISGEDVSLNCNFEIVNPSFTNVLFFVKEAQKVYLHWNDSIKHPQFVSFKVKVTYSAKQFFYPLTFWINFIQN